MKKMFSLILCSLDIHNYKYSKETFIVKGNDLLNERKITLLVRECKRCKNKQRRTNLPLMNGYDNNKWINYEKSK